jgi:hypothetical protein
MFAKPSHIQEDFPHRGDSPYMGSLPIFGINLGREK